MSVAGNQYFTNVVNAAGQFPNLNAAVVDTKSLSSLATKPLLSGLQNGTGVTGGEIDGAGTAVTLVPNTLVISSWTGTATAVELPQAIAGSVVVIFQSTTALTGTDPITITCHSTNNADTFAPSQAVNYGLTGFGTLDFSGDGTTGSDLSTTLTLRTNANTNAAFGQGSLLFLNCVVNGLWHVSHELTQQGTPTAAATDALQFN